MSRLQWSPLKQTIYTLFEAILHELVVPRDAVDESLEVGVDGTSSSVHLRRNRAGEQRKRHRLHTLRKLGSSDLLLSP